MDHCNNIALIGGTGKAGSVLVKELIKRGFRVKMLTRKPDKIKCVHNRIKVVHGDAREYKAINELITGCDTVISTMGSARGEEPAFSQVTKNVLRVMQAQKLSRFIVLTGLTLDIPTDKKGFRTRVLSGLMRRSFPSIVADKQRGYDILAESGLDWTLVRVPLIDQKEQSGGMKTDLRDCPGRKIGVSDLASFLIQQIEDTTYFRKAPFVSN
jgi:putative NADH-flavin reductase